MCVNLLDKLVFNQNDNEYDDNNYEQLDLMVEYKHEKHLKSSYGSYMNVKHNNTYSQQIYDTFNWIFYSYDLKLIEDKVFPFRVKQQNSKHELTQLYCKTFRHFYRLPEHETHDKLLETKILENPCLISTQHSYHFVLDEIKHLNLLYRRYGKKETDKRNRIFGLFANSHTIDELNCNIELLTETSNEYNIIHRYVTNSGENYFVKHIFKIERKTEFESFKQFETCKRMLLFHGTPIYNCYSILLNGLKVSCLWHQKGVGLFFGDTPQKSYSYSQKLNGYFTGKCYDFVILFVADVAVGNIDGTGVPNDFTTKKYGSLYDRDMTDIAIIDNAIVPFGKLIVSEIPLSIHNNYQYTEYFVSDSELVKLKYMIVMRND